MNIRIKNQQDFWSGVMFVLMGIAFALGATKYSMGTAARMGPGYFPFWLGTCLAILGAFVALNATSKRAEETTVDKFDWPVVLILLGSVVLCGLLMNYLGVYISVFLLVFISSFASHVFNWKVAAITGISLVLFVWAAFIKGLGLIFPLWPSFMG